MSKQIEYPRNSTVVAFQDSKSAVLYFDNVIPIELSDLIPIRESGQAEMFEILRTILPSSLVERGASRGVHSGIIEYVSNYLVTFPGSLGIQELTSGETHEQRAQSGFPNLVKSMSTMLDANKRSIHGIVGLSHTPTAMSSQVEEPSLVLAGLRLVDTSALTWNHLLAFRKDDDALRQLRNLRLFAYEHYKDKPKGLIEDDILRRVDDYNDTVNKWGMRTVESAFRTIFSSKSLAAVGAAGIVAALSGGLALPAAAAAGALFEIGAITLEIRKQKRELHQFRKDDPISYIVDVQKLSEGTAT